MNVLTFHKPIELNFAKGVSIHAFKAQPGRHYVFGRAQLNRLASSQEFIQATFKQSLLDMRIANFVARPGSSGTLLVYNGCGGFGDQIMTWPLTLILHNMGYRVHVLVDPGNSDCWVNVPWVQSVSTLPLELSLFCLFDHHAMFEVVANLDEHSPQFHPLDTMLFKMGLDPNSVAKELKVVAPQFTPEELVTARAVAAGRKIGIFQLTAASRVRSLTPDESVHLLNKLARQFPNVTWFAVYDGLGHSMVFTELLKEHLSNVVPYTSPTLRGLWALTALAAVCVAPDSMIVHVAGSLGVPCVGLWGPVGPETRVSYYSNHHPIFPREACAMSPCHSYTTAFPKYCPTPNPPQCLVLSAISFERVAQEVGQLL